MAGFGALGGHPASQSGSLLSLIAATHLTDRTFRAATALGLIPAISGSYSAIVFI